jgi:hypothetical protein
VLLITRASLAIAPIVVLSPIEANGRPAGRAGVRDEASWAWIVHDLNLRAFIAKLKGYIPA